MNRRTFIQQSAAIAVLPSLRWTPRTAAPLHVNGERVNSWLTAFNSVGRTPGGINRVAYSDADLAGRAFTIDLMKQAGLTPRIDTAGNIFARVRGSNATLKPILIGSHIDSVPDGGNFDGAYGSFSAIEVARTLLEKRITTRHPIDVVVWQNEEGGTFGSKLAIGALTDADLSNVARSGKTIREGIGLIGGDVSRLSEAVMKKGDVACYIELHIEQGGLLEKAGLQIGIVEGIVGLIETEITITGMANHAGATPMDQRHDAMLAAAKFTVAINDATRAEQGRQVATVGRIVVSPNTANVIAGQAVMTLDLRDLDAAKIARFRATFERIGREIGRATDTSFQFRDFAGAEPAVADPRVMTWIDDSIVALGFSRQRMPSGAVHDAQEMARIAPMGMIVIPSVGGISHSPKEFSKAVDISNGADVLLNAVMAADKV